MNVCSGSLVIEELEVLLWIQHISGVLAYWAKSSHPNCLCSNPDQDQASIATPSFTASLALFGVPASTGCPDLGLQ